jgi:hypothetical protein
MSEINLTEPIPVKTFGFNVPCREFVISAQITLDRRMPMVDEFVLRVLNACETVSSSRLMRFFGFSASEMQIVLADLQARSLVSVDGNNVTLHPAAMEMFRTAGDGPPTITSVESFPARVLFDLISQSMVASRGRYNVKHLIALKPVPARMDIAEGFAREAFSTNFHDYLQNLRGTRNADQWSLYAIVDVQPGRFSYIQIAGKQELSLGMQPKLDTTLLPTESDRPNRLRLLTDAMAQALSTLDDPEPAVSARAEWSRLLASDSIERATTPDGFIDLREWIRIVASGNDPEVHAFIGHPYLDRNRQELMSILGDIDFTATKGDGVWPLFWYRPGGSSWGVTEDIVQLLNDVRAISRRRSINGGVTTTLVVPAGVRDKSARNFDRIFGRGLLARAGRLSPAIEAILISDFCAVVSVHVPVSPTVSVPIGLITVRLKDVQRIRERLRPDDPAPELTSLWNEDHAKRPNQLASKTKG